MGKMENNIMELKGLKIGDEVVYIPKYLLVGDKDKMIKEENLGVIISQNDLYYFVKYKNKNYSQATNPQDLYPLKNRPDLIELLNS